MTKSPFVILLCLLAVAANAQYTYIENPELFEENKWPARASFIFDTQETIRPIQSNPNYLLLNGDWLFQHSNTPEERPLGFYKNDFNIATWATIPVPGDWQMYAYDYPIYTNWKYPFKPDKPNVPRDFNPVGSYKKTFTLPQGWDKGTISLYFGGVNSCFFVWMNGEYVGYSEDSKLPSEFVIQDYLQSGENQIAVEVYKYCDGTYLEDQDMWRLSGIERDVYLYKWPEDQIFDFTVNATLDESYTNGKLEVEVVCPGSEDSYFELILKSAAGETVWQRKEFDTKGIKTYYGEITDVAKWSAAHPNLYTLHIRVKNARDELLQKIEQQVGFRSLEIIDGIFFINGDTALIKGVNRHEHDPHWGHAVGYTGNVVNEDSLRKDLALIKSLNFNAVRTAHYPNHPMFYDLCDELGLYVCDEANVEGHWYMMFKPFDNLAIDPDYHDAILTRIHNMYQRDKNHPCVIMWSVGNETGTGKTMVDAYKMLKYFDPNRPVFNERHFFLNTIKEKHSDFNGNMYAPIEKVAKIIKKDKERPFIWIEYAHAMGNSTGNFKDLWDFVRANPQVQGGFVWDWRDQGIWKTNEDGERFLAYGGHFEPKDVKYTGGLQGDGNFCANGVISADGKLHPGAYEMAHVQKGDFQSDKWKLHIAYPIKHDLSDFGGSLVVSKSTNGLKIQGEKKQIARIIPQASHSGNLPDTSFYNSSIFELEFNEKGRLQNYLMDGDTLISEFGLNFWRAPTDNDFGNGMPKRCSQWRDVSYKQQFLSMELVENFRDSIVVLARFQLPKNEMANITYTIFKTGQLKIELDMILAGKSEIPRIGSYLKLSVNQTNIEYGGFGPHENYIDRLSACRDDEFVLKVDKEQCPYIRPQEYGNRTNVIYLLSNELEIASHERFAFSAWSHSLWDLEEYPEKTGKTPIDIPRRDYIWLNIDHAQMGVGGDNSWGRKPYEQYMLKAGEYSYSYTISPR